MRDADESPADRVGLESMVDPNAEAGGGRPRSWLPSWIHRRRVLDVLFVGCVVALLIYLAQLDRFDRRVWESKGKELKDRRVEMAEQLVESGRLLGMTRESVIELLGEPSEPEEKEHRPKAGGWAYHLGWNGGSPGNMAIFRVGFDQDGKVVGAEAYQ